MVLGFLKIFAAPLIWVLFLLAGGLVLTAGAGKQSGLKKNGWYALLAGTCLLFMMSFGPAANLLVYSLESGFPPLPSEELSRVDVMVILGGGIVNSGGFRAQPEAAAATYARVFNGVEVFKKSNAGVLVLSGGGIVRRDETEAAVMKKLAMSLGVSDDRLILETKSRNTGEQAAEVKDLVSLSGKSRIGVVTSSIHMARSLRAFKKVFPRNAVVAVPVQYMYSPFKWSYKCFIPSAEAFVSSTAALHEWIGLLRDNIQR
ncbi:MAG: YdcF family protein [Candidatus Omnitrophota bacterium]|jgi:uncharacterized SAM-binding protein YcdF (DUF218 family)